MSTSTKGPAIRTHAVRVICLLVPKAGLTFEEFDDYWRNTHGPLFATLPIAQNLIKYEQFHYNPTVDDKFISAGVPVLNAQMSFRGVMVWEAESYDKITAILSDPEYLERVVPDALNFCDTEKSVWVAGGMADVINKRST